MNDKVVEVVFILAVAIIIIGSIEISNVANKNSQELYAKKGLIECSYNRGDYWLKPEQCVDILKQEKGK